jgi:hypothetical protein
MSKGSKRRPLRVSQEQFNENWDRVFEKWEQRRVERLIGGMEILDKIRQHKRIEYKTDLLGGKNDSNEQTR